LKNTYNITMNVTINVKRGKRNQRIPWISFVGWKDGVIQNQNRYIKTDPIVKMTNPNMIYLGKQVFEAAKGIFWEDIGLIQEAE
jgi:hypothetical protein